MITTAIIAFREFLEAFLMIGVFWGLSKSLKLNKEKEIALAAAAGFIFSITITLITYYFGASAQNILTEKNADTLESYLLIFSGCFLAYVIFSLHKTLHQHKMQAIKKVSDELKNKTFDVSLFLTIFFMVMREGFEIALFTASTSLFAVFSQNLLGLLLGFLGASIIGLGTALSFLRFPIKRVFQITEYAIMLLGASLVQNGLTKLITIYWQVNLSKVIPLHLSFLPDSESMLGHAIQTFTGLDQQFSLLRLFIMLLYIGIVYRLFIRKNHYAK
ncbi:MAG TPA: FTR1 family protein [Patescibacteria group bacterium]